MNVCCLTSIIVLAGIFLYLLLKPSKTSFVIEEPVGNKKNYNRSCTHSSSSSGYYGGSYNYEDPDVKELIRIEGGGDYVNYLWKKKYVLTVGKKNSTYIPPNFPDGIYIAKPWDELKISWFKSVPNIRVSTPKRDVVSLIKKIIYNNDYDVLFIEDPFNDLTILYGDKSLIRKVSSLDSKKVLLGTLVVSSQNNKIVRVFDIPFIKKPYDKVIDIVKMNMNKNESMFMINEEDYTITYTNRDTLKKEYNLLGFSLLKDLNPPQDSLSFILDYKTYKVTISFLGDFDPKEIVENKDSILFDLLRDGDPIMEEIELPKAVISLSTVNLKDMLNVRWASEDVDSLVVYLKNEGYNCLSVTRKNSNESKCYFVRVDFWPPELLLEAANYVLRTYPEGNDLVVMDREWRSGWNRLPI